MQVLGDELDITLLKVQWLQSLLDSGARDKEVMMEIEGEQQVTEKENSDGEEKLEEYKDDDGQAHQMIRCISHEY